MSLQDKRLPGVVDENTCLTRPAQEILELRAQNDPEAIVKSLDLFRYMKPRLEDWGWHRQENSLGDVKSRHDMLLRDLLGDNFETLYSLGGVPTIWEHNGYYASRFFADGGALSVFVYHDNWRRLGVNTLAYPAEIYFRVPAGAFFSVGDFIRGNGGMDDKIYYTIWINYSGNSLGRGGRGNWYRLKTTGIVDLRTSSLLHELGHSVDPVPFAPRDALRRLKESLQSYMRYGKGMTPSANSRKLNKRIGRFRQTLREIAGPNPSSFLHSIRLVLSEESFAWDAGFAFLEELDLDDYIKENFVNRRETFGRTYDKRAFVVFLLLARSFEEFVSFCRSATWVSKEFALEVDHFINEASTILRGNAWQEFVEVPIRILDKPSQPEDILANPIRLLGQLR